MTLIEKQAWCSTDNTYPAGNNLKPFLTDSTFLQLIDSPTRFGVFFAFVYLSFTYYRPDVAGDKVSPGREILATIIFT